MGIEINNPKQSVLGSVLLAWIKQSKYEKTPEEQIISSKLYHKYIVDRNGNPKNRIYPEAYYYVNYNNKFNPDVYLAYIVRDNLRSPREIPDSLSKLEMGTTTQSYKGSLIQEWAYFQNASADNDFFMEGCDLVTNYFECDYPLKNNIYYFVSKTPKGMKVYRDLEKSPRSFIKSIENY